MKILIILILTISLINLSCSAGKVLTAEQQAGYDIINAHFSRNKKNGVYITKAINRRTVTTRSAFVHDFSNITSEAFAGWISGFKHNNGPSFEEVFTKERAQRFTEKTQNLGQIKLDPNFILNNINLYRGEKAYIYNISFPIISDDGNYGIMYVGTIQGEDVYTY